jgi:hypothetical protein
MPLKLTDSAMGLWLAMDVSFDTHARGNQRKNVDAALTLLERAYPVRQRSLTPYRTVTEARTDTTRPGDSTSAPTPASGSHRI